MVLYAILEISQRRSLAADGAWTLIQGLTHEGYWLVDPYRLVGGSLGQTPFAILTMLGVSDVGVLTAAHGVGYLLIPALAWAGALLLVRDTTTYGFLLLGYCATALTSGFVAVGDYNALFAFTALCFAAIMRFSQTRAPWLAWLALVSSVVVAVSHGLAVLLTVALAATIDVLWRAAGSPKVRRLPWILTLIVLAAGFVIGVLSVVRPYSPGNVAMAADLAKPLTGNHALQFLLAWLIVLPLAVVPRKEAVRVIARVVLLAALVAFVLLPGLWSTPLMQHFSRTWSAIILTLLLACSVLVRVRELRSDTGSTRLAALQPRVVGMAMALMVALGVPAVVDTVRFGNYVNDFESVVRSHSGVILNDDFLALVPDAARYGWPWAYPSMSVVLGIGTDHAMVGNPSYTVWTPPFTVDDPPQIPSRFG